MGNGKRPDVGGVNRPAKVYSVRSIWLPYRGMRDLLQYRLGNRVRMHAPVSTRGGVSCPRRVLGSLLDNNPRGRGDVGMVLVLDVGWLVGLGLGGWLRFCMRST